MEGEDVETGGWGGAGADLAREYSRLETAHLSAWGGTGLFVFVADPPQEEPEPLMGDPFMWVAQELSGRCL